MKSLRLIFPAWLAMFVVWNSAQAQTALPGFTVKELTKGKTQISWINPYPSCIQLAVQRSYDSITNFRAIFSSQSPELLSNGFGVAQAMPRYKVYYRIFYVLRGGQYFFSNVKRVGDNSPDTRVQPLPNAAAMVADAIIRIYKRGELALKLPYKDFLHFRDSIINRTSDSLYTVDADSIDWRPFVAKALSWIPSPYVFTNDKGYLTVRLPDYKQHRYRIVFFEENGQEIFQIKAVKENEVVLDKASFIHSGWFQFELYEDEKLKEKNKFFLDKN